MSIFQESYAHLSDGRPVYYFEEGDGPPLLFLHGALNDADFARPMIEVLRDRFHCISLDRVGYHRSGWLDRPTTLDEQIEGIAAVHSAHTSDPIWIFGWSSGGNYALAYAVAYPDRVRGLVLMEPALYAVLPAESRPAEVTLMIETFAPLLPKGKIAEPIATFIGILNPELSAETRDQSAVDALSSERWAYWEALTTDQPLVVSWSPTPAEWAQLAQPSLVIDGDQSWEWIREVASKVAKLLPRGELATLRGLDHGAPKEAPDQVAQTTIEFINRAVAAESEVSPTM